MANIITGIRIVLSAALLFCPALSPRFYALYVSAGFSDMIDGAVARRTGTVSAFGSRLDTIADIAFVAESRDTDEWYEYFEDVASLLDHPKSLVRDRALYILAANAQWDEENQFDQDRFAKLEEIKRTFAGTEKNKSQEPWLRFSASMGMAEPEPGDENAETVFHQADQVMYADKQAHKKGR